MIIAKYYRYSECGYRPDPKLFGSGAAQNSIYEVFAVPGQ